MPFPASRDLPDPGIEPLLLESPAFAGGFFTTPPTRKPLTLRRDTNFVPLCQARCTLTEQVTLLSSTKDKGI